MSISSILVPIDGTELSEAVLNPVHRLLRTFGGEVTLLRGIEPNDPEDWPSLKAARARLLSMIEDHEAERFKTDMRLERGAPAEVIQRQIERMRPDLVAMTTHGRTGLPRLVKGSVTETILRTCSVPTLLCNSHGGRACNANAPFVKILVPLDGSEVSHRVFPTVMHVAKAFGSTIVLARIVEDRIQEGSPEWEHVVGYLDRFADRLHAMGLEGTELHIASGDPAKTILEAVEDHRADLVAMATHGRTGFDRLRLGSVAEEVLRHCPCPMLVFGSASP